MGEDNNTIRKTAGNIPRRVFRNGTCNTTRIDISSTRHLGHRRLVSRSGEDDLGNLFAPSFLKKDENPLPRCRRSKYGAHQEIRTGTPESSDVSSVELLKLHVRDHRTDTVRDTRGGVIQ